MVKAINISILILLSNITTLFGQSLKACDKVYANADNPALFKNGKTDLTKYFEAELLPIISKCVDRDNIITASLNIKFTINKSGLVADVDIDKGEMTATCKAELKNKISKMTGWRPAKIKGRFVCSVYDFSVDCLYWVEDKD